MIIFSEEVKKGDTVYLVSGQEAEYIMKAGDGHLVYPIFQDSNEEPFLGEEKYVKEVFSSPPIEKICKLVQEKTDELNAINTELTEVRKQKLEIEKTKKEFLSKLEHIEGLKRIDDYLSGKITHYVVESGYELDKVNILSIKDAVTDDSSYYRNEPRLLCLYGTRKESIKWKYGDSQFVYLCCSFEEAKELAEKIINEKISVFIKDKHVSYLENIIESAQTIGMSVPKEATRFVIESKINLSNHTINRLTSELDKEVKNRHELEKSLIMS